MSMKSWTREGYGYQLFNENNLDDIKKFLIENGNYTEDEIQTLRTAVDEFDLQEVTDDPVSWIIASHINAKEGLACVFEGYNSCGDTDQEQMIGICPRFSWELEPENMLSRTMADEILEKYAKVLGITEKQDYFTAEYYG